MLTSARPLPRVERLVLPQPALDRLGTTMRNNALAILGPNEVQIYDVGPHSQSAIVWNFAPGKQITRLSGALLTHLQIIQGLLPAFPQGFAILDINPEGIRVQCMPITLPQDRAVRRARLLFSNGSIGPSVVEFVRGNFNVLDWEPHGVIGGQSMILYGESAQFGEKLCLVSSKHISHPEIFFPPLAQNTVQPILVTFLLNYYLDLYPSIEVVIAMVKFQVTHKIPMSTVIGTYDRDGKLSLKAWTVGNDLSEASLLAFQEDLSRKSFEQFGTTTTLFSHPIEVLNFRLAEWIAYFENRLNGRSVFEVPIQNGAGVQITQM